MEWWPRKLNGIQLYGVFLLCAMMIFSVISFLVLREQSNKSLERLEQQNNDIKLIAAERYISQTFNNYEKVAQTIANHQVITATALGGTAKFQEIHDRLNIVKPLIGEHYVIIIDIVGDIIFQEIQISPKQTSYLRNKALEETKSTSFYLFSDSDKDMLIVAIPIIYNGYYEGVMAYISPFDVKSILAPLQVSENYWFGIKQSKSSWGGISPRDWIETQRNLPHLDLQLIYSVNPSLYTSNQNQFVRALILGIALSVMLTYTIVYFLGKKLLVSPYTKLERSEQKLAERTKRLIVKEAEASRLAKVAKHMLDAIVITDVNCNITWVNSAFENLTGYKSHEVLGKKPSKFLQGPDTDNSVTKEIRTALDNRSAFQCKLVNYTKQGQCYWIEIALVPIFNDRSLQLEGFMAVERDISEQVTMLEDLETTSLKAQSANIAKSQFLASISHELRTPMNGVMGLAQLLTNSALDKEQSELMENLLDSSKHMLTLLNDILDFSKVEAGQVALKPINFSVNKLIEKVKSNYEVLCQEKGVTFTVNNLINNDDLFFADEKRIFQVVLNLVNNAYKFTQDGSIQLSYQIYKDTHPYKLVFEVKDTGIGIAVDKQAIIFDPFSQADSETTRKYEGTGLGLAITAKLVESMNGSIELQSRLHEGSLFRVTLPVERAIEQSKDDSNSSDNISTYDGSGMSALIVEDNKVNQLVLRKFLKKRGFECDIANNGEIGLQMASSTYYDLIMMDNHMPIMDGTEATERIKALGTDCSNSIIIACTADAFEENRQKLLRAGCVEIITKPIKANTLDNALHRQLSKLKQASNL